METKNDHIQDVGDMNTSIPSYSMWQEVTCYVGGRRCLEVAQRTRFQGEACGVAGFTLGEWTVASIYTVR